MTEPKYKVEQMVELTNGVIGAIDLVYDRVDREPEQKYEVRCQNVYESEILHPVKVYRDYGKVFCKDCKHYFDEGKRGYAGWSKKCPLWSWSWRYYRDTPSLKDENDNDLQPPPKCNCFDPKDNNADKDI